MMEKLFSQRDFIENNDWVGMDHSMDSENLESLRRAISKLENKLNSNPKKTHNEQVKSLNARPAQSQECQKTEKFQEPPKLTKANSDFANTDTHLSDTVDLSEITADLHQQLAQHSNEADRELGTCISSQETSGENPHLSTDQFSLYAHLERLEQKLHSMSQLLTQLLSDDNEKKLTIQLKQMEAALSEMGRAIVVLLAHSTQKHDQLSALERIESCIVSLSERIERNDHGALENDDAAENSFSATGLEDLTEKSDLSSEVPKMSYIENPEIELSSDSIKSVAASASSDHSIEKEILLEPGSGTPDLASLVQQVNEHQNIQQSQRHSSGADIVAEIRKDQVRKAARIVQEMQEDKSRVPGLKNREKSSHTQKLRLRTVGKWVLIAGFIISLLFLAWFVFPFMKGFMEASAEKPVASKPLALDQPMSNVAQIDHSRKSKISEKFSVHTKAKTQNINMAGSVGMGMGMGMGINIESPESLVKFPYRQEIPALAPQGWIPHRGFIHILRGDNTIQASALQKRLPAKIGSAALREAAENGNSAAQFEIARRYARGDSVPSDFEVAEKWYRLAADQNLAVAQYWLGSLYEKGRGVKRDLGAATLWYERAAEQGNTLAMHNLAVLHASGMFGRKPDMMTAGQWFLKAAEFGIKDSQVNIGILYSQGIGVGINLQESYKWFWIAAAAGDNEAASKRDLVGKILGVKKLAEAKMIAHLWKPKKIKLSANIVHIPSAWKSIQLASQRKIDFPSGLKPIQ